MLLEVLEIKLSSNRKLFSAKRILTVYATINERESWKELETSLSTCTSEVCFLKYCMLMRQASEKCDKLGKILALGKT